jgi:hypothetical protein
MKKRQKGLLYPASAFSGYRAAAGFCYPEIQANGSGT